MWLKVPNHLCQLAVGMIVVAIDTQFCDVVVGFMLCRHILSEHDVPAVCHVSPCMSCQSEHRQFHAPCNQLRPSLGQCTMQDVPPRGWAVEVMSAVERLVYFGAERQEILCPPAARAEVGIFAVYLELPSMSQGIEHCVEHVVQFYKEAAALSHMIDESAVVRLVQLSVLFVIHKMQFVSFCILIDTALVGKTAPQGLNANDRLA